MSDLDEMIRSLQKMGAKEVEERIAAKATEEIRKSLLATLSAGASPEGVAWAPRKKDGGRAYANAASKLTVKNFGSLIRVAISGGEAFGQYGVAGAPVRQMIPDGGAGMPPSVGKALEAAADAVMQELTK